MTDQIIRHPDKPNCWLLPDGSEFWGRPDDTAESVAAALLAMETEEADPLPALRVRRDAMLRESDWTQLADAPVDRKAWAAYRQKLRDLTKTEDPAAVVWPAPPKGTP